MKIVFSLLFCLVVSINCVAQRNVILIIADDLGTDYCGFYENQGDTINMPNVRRLLAKGVRFQNAMSSPLCSATRAGIFTGRYSFRTGVGGAIGFGSGTLDTAELSIPRLLNINAPNVMATAQIGKWHITADTPATNLLIPNLMGYEHFSGIFGAGLNYYYWNKITNGIPQLVTNYATTETTNDAIAWIKDQNSKPFFLWLAYNAGHTALNLPPAGLHSYTTLSGTQQDIDEHPKLYFKAMVEAMDHEIGRLFDSLQTYNKFDSTDFVFIADNGNSSNISQTTLDSLRSKGTLYQHGYHVPAIISGPSVVNPNRTSNARMNTVDLFATILELAGDTAWRAQIPSSIAVDSKSLIPILKDTAIEVRPWAFTELINGIKLANDGKVISNSDYNLLHFDNGKKEFYNIKIDTNEIANLLTTALTDSDVINYNYLCNELATLVADTSGCNAIISVTPAVTNVWCNGNSTGAISLQITGAEAPYTYNWNDGVSTQNRNLLSAGTYTVTITDSKFQSRTRTIEISQSSEIQTQFITNQTVCGGDIELMSTGGMMPYSYLWNNGITNSVLNNVTPGLYVVTVTDDYGCIRIDSIEHDNPNALSIADSQTNVYCNTYFDGTATVIPSGGTPDYIYIWSNGQTNQTATGLTSAAYTVQVIDSNGCSLIKTFNITETDPLISNLSNSNSSCNQGCNGSATAIVVSGGDSAITYIWSDGQSTQLAANLCAGSYTVILSNSSNCTSSNVVEIVDPPVLQGVSSSQLSCNNPGYGIAIANVTGGGPPYLYLWSNGQTTQTATGLSTASYTITVTDANGCIIQYAIPVVLSPPLFSTTTFTNPTCSSNKGKVKILVTGGKTPYQYLWNNGATTSYINNLSPGVYTVSVTDNAGCTLSASKDLIITGTVPVKPGAIAGPINGVCAGSTNINYSVVPLSNTNSYLWTAPANATIVSGQGTNSVNLNFNSLFSIGQISVMAVNFCGSSAARTASVKSIPSIPVSITGPVSVCANQLNVAYSTDPVIGATTYLWTKPPASIFVSGQSTTGIVVNFGAVTGKITVKAGNVCGYSKAKTSQIYFNCREAENETDINDFKIYPNPTSDFINISFNSDLEATYYFELKDVMGRVVKNLTGSAQIGANHKTMNVIDLTNGIYFLMFENNGVKTTRKVSVEK